MEKIMEQIEILVKSSMDGSEQPSLFFEAAKKGRPLLVGLHTWSFNRFNQIDNMLPFAKKHDFNLLLPEFRGANNKNNPECKKACGSEYVVADVKDAIDYCVENFGVDKNNIFLLGASGGGQVALLTAAKYPELFVAVGAFVPVCDLVAWGSGYYKEQIIACCGGEEEMLRRSPISYIDGIAKANVKIFHGKHDPVVPRSQSIELYGKLCEKYPNAKVYLDIFDGGHEMDMLLAEHWLISQYKKLKIATVTG
jgi:dipeptidyl aminopeptidase/acylaminoacyl peptidase